MLKPITITSCLVIYHSFPEIFLVMLLLLLFLLLLLLLLSLLL